MLTPNDERLDPRTTEADGRSDSFLQLPATSGTVEEIYEEPDVDNTTTYSVGKTVLRALYSFRAREKSELSFNKDNGLLFLSKQYVFTKYILSENNVLY